MQPMLKFSDGDRASLVSELLTVEVSPYKDYAAFRQQVVALAGVAPLPESLVAACERVRHDRSQGSTVAHVLANCPIDEQLPVLGHDDPSGDKRARKTTFVGEAFLELFAQLTGTPLLAYAARFGGDFFTDVIAINRYRGQQTGYSDGEVVFHNDRTAHPVRADYITLLGMRCPPEELVYTGFVSGRTLLAHLDAATQRVLRSTYFVTPFDVVSRDDNAKLEQSPAHAILSEDYSIRYLDTHTMAAPETPVAAKDALLALKNALARAQKIRHRLRAGDILTFANQQGLHNREHIEIHDAERALSRWLLKTYAFRDHTAAHRHAAAWVDNTRGKVAD